MTQGSGIQRVSLADLIAPKRQTMLRSLKLGVGLFALWAFITQDWSTEIFWLGIGVCLLSFFPAYLYCRRPFPGLPIFPLFAFTHLWAFGLPLLSNETRLQQYPIVYVAAAAGTVAAYLVIATVAYVIAGRRRKGMGREILVIRKSLESWLWVPLLMALGFNITTFFGIGDRLGPIFPVIQATMLALQALAVFVLAFRYGNNEMSGPGKIAFVVVLFSMIIIQASSLLLIGAMTIFLIATVAFATGRGRLPWVTFALCLTFFAVLHAGKSKMREHYWTDESEGVGITQLPEYFIEWFGYSFENGVTGLFKLSEGEAGDSPSLLQRSSLLHLLVFEEAVCPDNIPYLNGETYALIPQLLVPRFMNKEKIWSHEGTYILNIHFGIQTSEQTLSTTIGWGLLNEAFANFGLVGVAALAVVLGGGYGLVERWTAAGSLLSMRVFLGILILTAAFQTEYTSGVLVSSLFQGICALSVLSFTFMEPRTLLTLERFAPNRVRGTAKRWPVQEGI